ncbi:MAPEG family protein [Pseudoxanthomonas sp. z9]|uniref:MAPEG family protein n=1 Tax=Pseudoxanthomonas sp. z9 TaxID=2584942 RepID=UPI001143644D|nr:MAPEG family protein [Pseudoxanthomonas sp. z9]
MSIEMRMLLWTTALGIAQLLLAAALATAQRGVGWNVSARDGTAAPLTGVAGRMERAWRNLMETFPFFAALALAAVAGGRGDATTAIGAQLYFWSRLVYVPLYALGVPYLRSLVWTIGLWGLLQMLWGLVT